MEKIRVGIIGGGNMGKAIMAGLMNRGFDPQEIFLVEIDTSVRNEIEKRFGVPTSQRIDRHIVECEVIILAVKPHDMRKVLDDLASFISESNLLISVAAGVTLSFIERYVGKTKPIARIMPNIAARVGEAATAICFNKNITTKHQEMAMNIMESIGIVIRVEESQMDAVTGLSGSGPAYIFLMIEALADGGVLMGLPREKALAFAIQTVQGAISLLRETGDHPAVLKDRVTSPGGTTAEGLLELENGGFRHLLMRAVKTATEKSAIIGRKLSD